MYKVPGATSSHLMARYLRLGLVAGVSFFSNLFLTYCLVDWIGMGPESAFAIVLCIIFTGNFLVTRYWVFRDRAVATDPWRQLRRCALVSCLFRVLEWAGFALLLNLTGLHYLFCLVLILGVSFVCKGFVYDRYVFR